MEGSVGGLVWGNMSAFAWRDQENHERLDKRSPGRDLNSFLLYSAAAFNVFSFISECNEGILMKFCTGCVSLYRKMLREFNFVL
jgi:hypothetical protein